MEVRWEGYRPFRNWLEGELNAREWRPIDLARRINPEAPANVASSISKWMSGKRQPDTASCAILADILGADLDAVLTIAGHKPARESDALIDSIAASLRALPRSQVEVIGTSVRALHDELVRRRLDREGHGGEEAANGPAPDEPKSRRKKAMVPGLMATMPAGATAMLHQYLAAGMPGGRRLATTAAVAIAAILGS